MIQDIDSGVARRLVSVVPYLIVAFKVVVPSPAPLVRQEIPNVFTSSHFQHSGPTIVQVYVTFESGFGARDDDSRGSKRDSPKPVLQG